ncbi:MAG: hypothetical protein Q7S19_01350 [bacterium]|nr:hypothetical protein [bacterium]
MDGGIKIIEWQAPDHELPIRATDWYISIVVIGVSASVAALFLGNFLFAIFCLLSTVSIIIHTAKKPEMIDFAITSQGMQIRHDFFSYNNLHSFWIDNDKGKNEIILHSDRNVLPHLIIPIRGVETEYVRMELRRHLPEKYAHKNFFDRSLEYLGF